MTKILIDKMHLPRKDGALFQCNNCQAIFPTPKIIYRIRITPIKGMNLDKFVCSKICASVFEDLIHDKVS